MAVLDYVITYEDVRVLLGVSDEELPDARIALRVFELSLVNELGEFSATLVADFAAASTAVDNGAATEDEQSLFDAVGWYSTYKVASDLLGSLSLFAPRTISDGDALLQRQSDDYAMVRDAVYAGLKKSKQQLLNVLDPANAASSAADSSVYVRISSPEVDPVVPDEAL